MRLILSEAVGAIGAMVSKSSTRTRAIVISAVVLSSAAAVATAVAPATIAPSFNESTPFALPKAGLVELDNSKDVLHREERVRKGDTLAAILARLGVDDDQASQFLRKDKDARAMQNALKPGKTFKAITTPDGSLVKLDYLLSPTEQLSVSPHGETFKADKQGLELERRLQMKAGVIRSSLFGATDTAGVPDAIAVQIAEIFAADIDFHKDLRKGDSFRVVYEMLYHGGEAMATGKVLAIEFTNKSKTYAAMWYEAADGEGKGYYSPTGNSLRKAFLKAPLEFSRITSGFGMRMHPIWKTWRGHAGVDYAAPTGTPIRTVSDGVVEFLGTKGGYGNAIVVKHQNKYSTLYGHMSAFAAKLKAGDKVSQGDVIGFVGSTGWSTGPHLHYEFRINDEQVDPLTVNLPHSVPLEGARLAAFLAVTAPYGQRLNLFKGEAALVAANFE